MHELAHTELAREESAGSQALMEVLRSENARLQARLAQAEAELRVVRTDGQRWRAAGEEREKLIQLIEHSRDFIATADLDGRLTFLNPAGRHMIGVGEGEPIENLHFADYVAPEARQFFNETVLPAMKECGRWEGEMQLRHMGTGARIDVSRSTFLIRNPETNEPLCYATVTRDITSHKEAERRVELAAERAEVAQRAALAVLYEYWPGTGKVFRSQMIEQVMGYRPGDLAETMEGWILLIHPEDTASYESTVAGALREGTSFSLEYRVRHKQGRYLWVTDQGQVMLDERGEVGRVVGMVRDITGQKQAEAALREQTALLQAITGSTPDMIYAKDRQLRMLMANPATLAVIGKPADAVLGRTDEDLHHDPAQAAAMMASDRRVMESGCAEMVEEAITPPGGGAHTFLSTKSPLRNDAGEVIGVVGVTRDISELKQACDALREAKEQAEAANRAKDAFLAALSHELRTPLNPVLMLAGEMEKSPELSPWLRADFALIRRNVELEARLIDDLLDLTRISRGKLQLELRPLDAHTLLRQTLDILRGGIEAKRIAVTLELDAPSPWVRGDPVRLQQVFWNVVKNGVKFTPAGGSLVLRTRNGPGGELFVEIRDTGIGIEPAEMERIFTAFGQGDHASSHRFGGLGLGLAICHLLVTLHSGRIWAESAGRGQGSTFHIELPGSEPESAPPVAGEGSVDATSGPARPGREGGPFRILLVEDHEATRAILARLLTRRSYHVTTAPTAGAAREWARARKFDLLLSDLGLPDGDGRALMTELKEVYGLRGIALSGYGMEEDVQRSLAAGFEAHLTKPVDVDALERAIAKVRP